MKINLSKTKIVVFRKYLQRRIVDRWYLNGENIEVVEQYNYLGLTYRDMRKFWQLDPKLMLKMFDCKVVPILTYGCELWGFSGIGEVEIIASNFYRKLLGLRNNASVVLARGELGRYEMYTNIMIRVIRYWLKIIRLPTDRALYKCYQYQLTKCENHQECWALHVKSLLFSLGFQDVWINQGPGNVNRFIKQFSDNCKNLSIMDWHEKVGSYGNLRLYNDVKRNFGLEWFLTIDLPKNVINTLVRLRGGLLRIAVNEGRWTGVDRAMRICPMCNSGSVEDEYHLIFYCRAWSTFRQNLTRFPVFNNRNFNVIFAVKDKNLLLEIARFITTVIDIREEILQVL